MSRWTSITADDVKAAFNGNLVDSARTRAVGNVDPVDEAIEAAVARVRRAVSAANQLDVDPTKIPKSLKAVTVRLVIFALGDRISYPFEESICKARDMDASDLNRLADRKILVEKPDEADSTTLPPNLGTWNSENKIVGRTHPVPSPGRQSPPTSGNYANPNAPEDSV